MLGRILVLPALVWSFSLVFSYAAVAPGQMASPGMTPASETWDRMYERDVEFQETAEPEDEVAQDSQGSLLSYMSYSASGYKSASTGVIPGIGTAFVALTLQDQLDSGFNYSTNGTPPDSMGAIGPNHFLEVINESVAIYTRSGQRVGHVSMSSFFGLTYNGVAYPRNGAFDPRVIFDRRSNRWYATCLERGNPTKSENQIILAVCRTSNPLTGTWDKYIIPVGEPPDSYKYQTDYATLGMDDNGVYFGMKIRSSSGSTRYKIAATPKAPLIAGSPYLGPVYQWGGISNLQCSPQPAHNQDAISSSDPAWFVTSSTSGYRNINYRWLTWSGGVPTLSSTYVVYTPEYGKTMDAPAYGSSPAIRVNDHRLMMAVIRNKRLWTCRNVGVNSSGGPATPTRNGCEWLELDVSGAKPTLAQSGRIYDNAEVNPRFYYCPSIMVNGQGHVALAFAGSRSTEWICAYACVRLATDPPGVMRDLIAVKIGQAAYQRLDDSGRNRWGETCYTSLDPNDDMSLWAIQEFPTNIGVGIWGTCVNQLLIAGPTLNNPSAIGQQGKTGCSLSLTGSGFYDPGSGYANRLSVRLQGGSTNGISNYKVTYKSPTSVSVTFDIASNASSGPRDIVLTNPDGQTATVTGGFTISGSSPPPVEDPVEMAKKSPDKASVTMEGVTVSIIFTNSSVFYVQSETNSCGIRIDKSGHGMKVGMKVNISGAMKTNSDGERYVAASTITQVGTGNVAPVTVDTISIGGADWFYDPATGAGQRGVVGGQWPNTIGLFVRVSGVVTQRVTTKKDYFYVDDGSGIKDGTTTNGDPNIGVKVKCNPGSYATGTYVTITGASTCFKDVNGNLRRRLLPKPGGVTKNK